MTRYKIFVDFQSDRPKEQLEKFLVSSLEKAGCSINYMSTQERQSAGRPPVIRDTVQAWVEPMKQGEEIVAEELSDALNLPVSSVKRALKRLAADGVVTRRFVPQVGVVYFAG